MEEEPGEPGPAPAPVAPPIHTDPWSDSPPPASVDPIARLHPWLSIWTRPRQTMRQILRLDPRRSTAILAALGGATGSLGLARPLLAEMPQVAPALLAAVTAGGALAGIAGLYVGGFLLGLTSAWLEGRGDRVATRAALAWSNVPGIWGAILWVPMIAAFGEGAFTITIGDLEGNAAGLTLVLLVGLANLAISIWGSVVFLSCLSEVQGFSAWRAVGASLLAGLLAALPLALGVLAFGGR